MDLLYISLLGVSYRYAVKIEQKFKQRSKQEFGFENMPRKKYGKGNPNSHNKGHINKEGQPQDIQFKTQKNKGNGKFKKDTGKRCEFHKVPWHNIDECFSKKSLVVELKEKESEPYSDFDSEKNKGKRIIDAEPTTTIMTTTIQPEELEELEEGEHLFHFHIWVNGTPLHFIVDNGS
jgi:hypothetical protein